MTEDDKEIGEHLAELEDEAFNNGDKVVEKLADTLIAFKKLDDKAVMDDPIYLKKMEYMAMRTLIAWLSYVTRDDTVLTDHEVALLGLVMPEVHALYRCFPTFNMDAYADIYHRRTEGSYDNKNLDKLLVLFSPDTNMDADLMEVAQASPYLACANLLATISAHHAGTEQSYNRINKSIGQVSEMPFKPEYMELLANTVENAYMYCSYSDREDKHNLKIRLNHEVTRAVQIDDFDAPPERDKPVVCVINEALTKGHSMNRCFNSQILGLKEHFHVVGMGFPESFEPIDVFDETFTFPKRDCFFSEYVKSCIETIREYAPDIIIYPSIGMNVNCVALSNFRLAPMQVMCLGHPASSMSEHIDYVVAEEAILGGPGVYTEKRLPTVSGRAANVMVKEFSGRIHYDRDVVKLAVSAMTAKINYPFLKALSEIETKRQVEFHFFLAKSALNYVSAQRAIKDVLPQARVTHKLCYEDYMAKMNDCDVYLSTFPFGGTNSVLDAFQAKMPVVSMDGEQPHCKVDGFFTRAIGLPEELIAKDVDEYKAVVEKLVDDEVFRHRMCNLVDRADLSVLYAEDDLGFSEVIYNEWKARNDM